MNKNTFPFRIGLLIERKLSHTDSIFLVTIRIKTHNNSMSELVEFYDRILAYYY